jgi:RNA polymerase sigma-70 factor, ECF subfamily
MLNIIASIQNGYALSNVSTSKPWSLIEKTSDQALIDSIAVGDKNAMQVLFARHKVRVYRFVLHLVGDASVAEDVISDVFLDVWRHADRFEARSSVQTWLLAIARYKALSALRSRSYEVLDENAAPAIEDPADNPEVVAQFNDRSAIVRKCLKQLSPAHQEIIDLVYYHEKSIAEISEIIRAPQNTVKTRMFYARKKMTGLLNAEGIDRVWS